MSFESLQKARQLYSLASPLAREALQASRAWRVVHACDSVRQVLPVVEAQASAGMKPYILTPQGECLGQSGFRSRPLEASKPTSLLTAWSEVRNWRRNFLTSEVETGMVAAHADLVHAHCFSAGMTAVRNSPAVVYSLRGFIENEPHSHFPAHAQAQAGHKEHSWLARSFAVAEQFVFTRAGAVVVHSGAMREELVRRGCAPENAFVVPDPLSTEVVDFLLEPESVFPVKRKREDDVVFFAPDVCSPGVGCEDVLFEDTCLQDTGSENAQSNDAGSKPCAASPPALSRNADCVLQAFAILRQEIRRARLIVPATPACAALLLEKSTALGIADAIFAISSAECGRMFAESDVIIALGDEPVAGKSAEPEFAPDGFSAAVPDLSSALRGMIAGVTLLAADTPIHRDLSPEGRGLLWFRKEDPRDLAGRAAFLAHNPDLCRSLAATARKHLLEMRSPQAVGCRYDAVYQHVFARRKSNSATPALGANLQPVAASL